jgi:hypothetical protein
MNRDAVSRGFDKPLGRLGIDLSDTTLAAPKTDKQEGDHTAEARASTVVHGDPSHERPEHEGQYSQYASMNRS